MRFFPLILAVLFLASSGCASMNFSAKKTDLGRLDAIAEDLHREPTPRVDEGKVRAAAAELEYEDDSLATLTAEKMGEKIAAGYWKMVGLSPNEQEAVDAYRDGIRLFDEGKYDEAEKRLRVADWRWPDSPLQEDAIFMRAEASFFAKRYAWAQHYYERLLKKYDSTRYLDRISPRLFAIGRYWDEQDQANRYMPMNMSDKERPTFDTFGNCIKAYKTIVLHDSRGLWADHALMAAGNAEYLREHYVNASIFYDQLIRDYPTSNHLLVACELNLSSKLLMYEGPQYDAKPLEDAEEIAERLLTQFGPKLSMEQKNALRMRQNQITEAKAERDMEMARYFETKHYYKAARDYYVFVMEDYPQTAAAQRAKGNFARIKDYPDEPKDYFAWLKKAFPER